MAVEPERLYRIVDLAKIPSAEAGRVGKYDLVVTYQDGAGRIRVVTLPYEEFGGKTPEEQEAILRKYIRAQEEERIRFVGRELRL
jgi:hypothetical protein